MEPAPELAERGRLPPRPATRAPTADGSWRNDAVGSTASSGWVRVREAAAGSRAVRRRQAAFSG
ncbi:MAG: hypothetical protein ACK52I_07295 [Pseudomonadota bacterium]